MPIPKSKFSPRGSESRTPGSAPERWAPDSRTPSSRDWSRDPSLVRASSIDETQNTPPSPTTVPSPQTPEFASPSKFPRHQDPSDSVKARGGLPTMPFLGRLSGGLAVYLVLAMSLSLNSLWLLSSALLSPAMRQSSQTLRWRPALSSSFPASLDPFESVHNVPPEELSKIVLGSSDCSSGSLLELKAHLQNVVLSFYIKDDAVARNTSQFLRSIYGRFFKAVVIIGPNAVPELGIEGHVMHNWGNLSGSGLEEALRASTSSNVGPWSFTSGSFSYLSFPKVVAMHPDAEGYLWAEDAVVINFWQLIRGDKSKLWLTDMPECLRCQGFIPFDHTIHPTVFDGWAGHPKVRKRARSAFSGLADKYKKQFFKSLQPHAKITSFPKRIVDTFYVPKRFSMQLAFDIIPLFREHGVVPELAVPTMFFALDAPENFDHIFLRSDHRMEVPGPKYDAAALWTPYVSSFFHWDLSSQKEKEKLIWAFSVADSCLLQLLPRANRSSLSP